MANEYIDNNNNIKIVEQAPLLGQLTDYEEIVSAQNLTDSYVDFGDEIEMNGYNKLGVFVVADTNNSTGVTINVLAKDETGGDEYEYDEFVLWDNSISDFKKYYEIDCASFQFMQLQAKAYRSKLYCKN
jgi:hypothetical protein